MHTPPAKSVTACAWSIEWWSVMWNIYSGGVVYGCECSSRLAHASSFAVYHVLCMYVARRKLYPHTARSAEDRLGCRVSSSTYSLFRLGWLLPVESRARFIILLLCCLDDQHRQRPSFCNHESPPHQSPRPLKAHAGTYIRP